jgi:hypothetical protein
LYWTTSSIRTKLNLHEDHNTISHPARSPRLAPGGSRYLSTAASIASCCDSSSPACRLPSSPLRLDSPSPSRTVEFLTCSMPFSFPWALLSTQVAPQALRPGSSPPSTHHSARAEWPGTCATGAQCRTCSVRPVGSSGHLRTSSELTSCPAGGTRASSPHQRHKPLYRYR